MSNSTGLDIFTVVRIHCNLLRRALCQNSSSSEELVVSTVGYDMYILLLHYNILSLSNIQPWRKYQAPMKQHNLFWIQYPQSPHQNSVVFLFYKE